MISVEPLASSTLGAYQIERQLGQSRLGAAYIARHISHGQTVMVTVFNFSEEIPVWQREQYIARLIEEKAALVGLTQPNILPIYDFGEQSGNLYQAIALTKGVSPARLLKQQGRLTPVQTLNILKQIAAGLDYAHGKGVVHGLLSLSNILINDDLSVQIAGFGLRTMLEACGSRESRQPQGYLFSTNGTFMGMPAYISPERVQGQPIDARSDIYTLGIILFELLSGTLPFRGDHPLDIALKRLHHPVPSLHAAYPDIPEALDLVIGKTLNLDPAKRYQRAGDIAVAFERVLQLLRQVEKTSTSRTDQLQQDAQITLLPTVNWSNEAEKPSNKWQSMPPLVTGTMPAVPPAGGSDSMAGFDPFAWWSATSASSKTLASRKPSAHTTVRLKSGNSRSRSQALHEDRRKLVGFIVAGTVTAGVFGVGGISFAHFVSSLKQSQVASVPTTGSTPTTVPTQGAYKTPAPSKSPTPKASPSATKSPQPSPTAQPTQPPPPSHTGTVIGQTSMPTNSAVSFTNPADGNGSLLVHLSNGNFAAFERACTHAGVPVNYDSGAGQFHCPAHDAIFSAANGSLLSGPGNGPLPGVSIRVNKDGTITTG